MTPPAPPRHLLVIAPQCPDQGMLDGLEDTARSLHAVLLDPAVGGCEKPPSGLSSLLCGPDVMQEPCWCLPSWDTAPLPGTLPS
jgi:hypothetical protein